MTEFQFIQQNLLNFDTWSKYRIFFSVYNIIYMQICNTIVHTQNRVYSILKKSDFKVEIKVVRANRDGATGLGKSKITVHD